MFNSNNNNYNNILTYNDLVFSNIGYIIGAGIFVLISETLSISGPFSWLSILIAGLFIKIISYSYVKVHKKHNSNDAEFKEIKEKMGDIPANISIIVNIIAIIFITYVVSIAFGNYSTSLFGLDMKMHIPLSIIGLLLAGILNIIGIQFTSSINKFVTISGLIGLFIIIIMGLWLFISNPGNYIGKFVNNNFSIWKILYGAFIFVFAYTGFEMIIRLNKESVDGETDIPNAMYTSIDFTIIMYTLIGLVMIMMFNSSEYSKISYNPLTLLVKKMTNNKFIEKYIDYCGVVLTWTTVLMSITYVSRLLREFIINVDNKNILGEINETTQTPIYAILCVILSIFVLLGLKMNMISASIVSNMSIIIVMLMVYISSSI